MQYISNFNPKLCIEQQCDSFSVMTSSLADGIIDFKINRDIQMDRQIDMLLRKLFSGSCN